MPPSINRIFFEDAWIHLLRNILEGVEPIRRVALVIVFQYHSSEELLINLPFILQVVLGEIRSTVCEQRHYLLRKQIVETAVISKTTKPSGDGGGRTSTHSQKR